MNNSNSALKALIEKMDYPIVQAFDSKDREYKIQYICEMAEQYENEQEVIDFIRNTGNNDFREVFELIYDSDLFKGD